MDSTDDSLYPLALLMDELKHDDVSNRVNAMQRIETIAIALGPERTAAELLPFLNEVAHDDEEEVFAVLADKLGLFIPLIGGHQNCEPLILILATLASMEEPIVRDKAIVSLNQISLELLDAELNGAFLALVRSLSLGNWFSKKIASCGLYKSIIARVSSSVRHECLSAYAKLVLDDYPMVRRSAATCLPALIGLMSAHGDAINVDLNDVEFILSAFLNLTSDDQDSVKLLSLDVLIAALKFFSTNNRAFPGSDFLDTAIRLMRDDSWRVRYTAADKFALVAESFANSQEELASLIGPFISLMEDNEAEVNRAIAKQIPAFCALLTKYPETRATIIDRIVPVVALLAMDPQENVRASLASTITMLSPILERQLTIDKLLPIFLDMLKDDFPEVRLNIILNLLVVNETIGISLLSTNLLPAITELAQDHKWRVRLAIIEYVPKLATQLGDSFFDNELLLLCMSWLWDPVYAIRAAAVTNLEELTATFGSQWANNQILGRILNDNPALADNECIDYSNFIIRITCLFAVSRLAAVVDYSTITSKILPFVKQLSTDAVPNIRFNVAKSLLLVAQQLLNHTDSTAAVREDARALISKDVVPQLQELLHDGDIDVRFFSKESLAGIEALLVT